MKTILTLLVFLSISAMALSQNDTSGVYLSAVDFANSKLTVPSACTSNENWIKIQKPLHYCQDQSEKHKFAKAEIFGVRTCRNNIGFNKTWNSSYQYRLHYFVQSIRALLAARAAL
ncbi:MAG: hypothetical protein IPK96_08785 [Flammeovirgaceae bacterium]|nr:hypothetical protein [Flammeovirgaceae bacterium]